MRSHPPCPVCDSQTWDVIGRRTYDASQQHEGSEYLRRRFDVLFQVWQPDATSFTSESLLCDTCGFVIYSPRPTHDELNAKYARLVEAGGDAEERVPIDSDYNRQRVNALHRILCPHLPGTGNRILDFGGGDGRLLQRFLDRGDEGFVIDYTPTMIPGVTKLGDTLEETAATEPFDAIVCSHVLEHVAEPRAVVERLRERLKPNGVLFVEVPMEIWRKPPLLTEPVTHVNFFTDVSMSQLLTRSGLHVVRCEIEGLSLPNGRETTRSCVVRAIARRSEKQAALPSGGPQRVRELLQPGLRTQIWWAMRHPSVLPASLLNRLLKRRSRTTSIS